MALPAGMEFTRTGSLDGDSLDTPTYHTIQAVVVPHKRVEGPQLGPAHTQLFFRVSLEATDVRPDQGHA